MKTAIIILNYNDCDTTIKMLNNIKNYNILDLIVVVDNQSSDNSYNVLKKYENGKIKVIKTDKNLGYSYGNNYGLRYLEDKNIDYVIISNPDIEVEEKVINELINDFKEDVTVVAPVVLENNNKSRGWKLPHFKEDLISNINYFHKYSKKMLEYEDTYYKDKLTEVDVVSGCFFIIRYDIFKKINYFDEGTFLYYEENILGSKLKELKLKTYIDNTCQIKHNLSVSVDKSLNSINKYKILKKSQIYYEKKYNKLNIFGIIILKLFYYISLFISYIHLFILNLRRKK